jgi:hypothetical protein
MLINKTAVAVVVIALWMPVLFAIGALQGCQAGTTGLLRPIDSKVEHSLTNAVATASSVAAGVVPQPWASAIEAGGAAVLALLAAWQGLTHSKIEKLRAETSANKKGPAP